jgi:hypothetical protein
MILSCEEASSQLNRLKQPQNLATLTPQRHYAAASCRSFSKTPYAKMESGAYCGIRQKF